MIFTRQWVGREIFCATEGDTFDQLVALDPLGPIMYKNNNNGFAVSESRIVVSALQTSPESLRRSEEIAVAVLSKLPSTPITAIGVNFAFIESSPGENLLEVFNSPDNSEFSVQDWTISSQTLTRQLEKDERLLNLKLSRIGAGDVEIEGNFHKQVASADQARMAIDGQVERFRRIIEELLLTTYDLAMEVED